jgi:predicted GH43/DUF377 family glycosyl hydrolase
MGRERGELFSVFAQMVRIFNHIKPSELKKITDLSVTFHPIHHATKTLPKESALLNSLYETGMDYECFDPRLAKIEKPVMFYSGAQWLDQASQEHLNDYVQRGGHLVVFRDSGKYKVGVMLLDLRHPEKVMRRADQPILEPEMTYENDGNKSGVVYVCGSVIKDGTLLVYYGASDHTVAVAAAPIDEFLSRLMTHQPIQMKAVTLR